jgi:hypothetical protein
MTKNTIAYLLISLCIIDFTAMAKYRLVEAFYELGRPVEAVLIFVGVAFALGIMGFVILVSEKL